MRQARIRGEVSATPIACRASSSGASSPATGNGKFAVALVRQLEAFLGVRAVADAAMSYHFHLLVEEPDRERLPAWMGRLLSL